MRGSLLKRRVWVLANTLFIYVIMRFGISVGGFVPKTYVQQVVENSDFRKYDDGLRMILDCTEELGRALTRLLENAASLGIVRYGVHRQDAAMMTCLTLVCGSACCSTLAKFSSTMIASAPESDSCNSSSRGL